MSVDARISEQMIENLRVAGFCLGFSGLAKTLL
jgi:hypothetical protein